MQVREYRIPEEPGEVLCSPPLNEWVAVARRNQRRAEGWTFSLAGWTAEQWRERTRYRLWGQTGSRPVILTGHQPVLFHPGIWIKAFAAALVARGFQPPAPDGDSSRGVGEPWRPLAYNMNVDSDVEERLGLWLPAWAAGRLTRRWLALPGNDTGSPRVPLERRPLPTRDQWARLAQEGRAALESFQEAGEPLASEGRRLLARWERFIGAGEQLLRQADAVGSLARFLAGVRQLLEREEGGPGLGEIWVSEMAATPEFLRFAVAWFQEAPRLVGIYNGQLAAYRRVRRIRSRANPFPDLRRYGHQWETPFWLIGPGGERADLFVRRPADADPQAAASLVTLCNRHGDLITLDTARMDEAVARLQESGLAIRPKAVALTLFLRLFACDLFVHGVGGGRYDHITDGVMQEWLGVEPPVYAVVSAHLPLVLSQAVAQRFGPDQRLGPPQALERTNETIARLRRNLRDLTYNPQRFAHQASGCEELAAEKEELIQAINQPGAPKRALTRRIEAVNAQLAGKLEAVRKEWQTLLEQAQDRRQQLEVAVARDYPYFLYEPPQLWQAWLETLQRADCRQPCC